MKKLEREYSKTVQPEYRPNDIMLDKKYYVFKDEEVKPKEKSKVKSLLKFAVDVGIGFVFKVIQGR